MIQVSGDLLVSLAIQGHRELLALQAALGVRVLLDH